MSQPWWKYVLVFVVITLAIIYALPNIYPEKPAVQISHERRAVTQADVDRIREIFQTDSSIQAEGINRFSKAGQHYITVLLSSPEMQLRAASVLKDNLQEQYIVALNLAPTVPDWLQRFNAKPMNLGLDLRGGVYFLLEVDAEAVFKKALSSYRDEVKSYFREEKLYYRSVEVVDKKLVVQFRDAAGVARGNAIIKREAPGLEIVEDSSDASVQTNQVLLQMDAFEIKEYFDFAIEQNIITLRKRVNELGVAEPIVTRRGRERIVVQLPGVQDTARAKEILGATATLEFRLVEEGVQSRRFASGGSKRYVTREGEVVFLKRNVMLTGEHIIDASSGIDSNTATPAVFVTLDGKGAQIFSRVTGANIKQLMGVVFIESKVETYRDETTQELQKRRKTIEEVISVARIQDKLSKRFQISGLDSPGEARKLALLLRAGALAAPLEIVEERTVGPSLGKANIEQGRRSIVLGFLLIILFMAFYYRVFGLIADVALAANIFLLIAIMSLIPGATLTLPGIIGIVLTVGMAVDANVLIFERIREEMDAGNSQLACIDSGYSRAFSTIADANITTLIAAVVLFVFGTGPIKGFAITLSIGILSSMFTAILGTRVMVDTIYNRKKQKAKLLI